MKKASGSPFASVTQRLQRRIRQRKQPIQRRSQETTQAILDGTLQVLLKDGFAALTTTRVAQRAGVSVGTLYQYYPDKHSLVAALAATYFAEMLAAIREGGQASGTLEETLRGVLTALLEAKRERIQLARALEAPLAERTTAGIVRDLHEQFVQALLPALLRAAPKLAHAERRASLLVAAINGAFTHAVFEHPDWLAERWFADELLALALGVLEPRT